MRLQNGTQIGPYEIQALLGSGGMGEVYRARDHELDRAYRQRSVLTQIVKMPEFQEVRSDPRFQTILADLDRSN